MKIKVGEQVIDLSEWCKSKCVPWDDNYVSDPYTDICRCVGRCPYCAVYDQSEYFTDDKLKCKVCGKVY